MGRFTQSQSPDVRFSGRIEVDGFGPAGCWLWTGSLAGGGRYANFMVDGRTVAVHRWAYERFRGPIPPDKQLDHMCGVTRCVNPWHVRPVEPYENVRAYWRSQRGVCRNGHAMTSENVGWINRKRGAERFCLTCRRASRQREDVHKRARS
jgi:hypothetical protein